MQRLLPTRDMFKGCKVDKSITKKIYSFATKTYKTIEAHEEIGCWHSGQLPFFVECFSKYTLFPPNYTGTDKFQLVYDVVCCGDANGYGVEDIRGLFNLYENLQYLKKYLYIIRSNTYINDVINIISAYDAPFYTVWKFFPPRHIVTELFSIANYYNEGNTLFVQILPLWEKH